MRLLSVLLLVLFLAGCAWHNKDYSLVIGVGEFTEKHPDGAARTAKTEWPKLLDINFGSR